jgi:hypothetical protein
VKLLPEAVVKAEATGVAMLASQSGMSEALLVPFVLDPSVSEHCLVGM